MSEAPGPFGPWPVLERRMPYRGRWSVIEERRLTPDGEIVWTSVEAFADAVVALPLTGDGHVVLVRQYRPPLDCVLLELPGGAATPGGDLALDAARELAEEVGLAAAELTYLTSVVAFGGAVKAQMHIYLARGLTETPRPGRDRHEFVEVVRMDFEELLRRVVAGDEVDVPLVVGTLLARQRGLA